MMLDLVIKSAVVGALAGAGAAGGAARMFHAPNVQGMGAFRTLGEMNACNGDPLAHFSYGVGFLFSSAGSVVGTGSLSSDVLHRIVPQRSAGASILLGGNNKKSASNPLTMTLWGALIGAMLVTFLNTLSNLIPSTMSLIAEKIVSPAADLILSPVLPVAFWMSALSAGKWHGTFATIFGILAQHIMGNATPGAVLGILAGQAVEDTGLTGKRSISLILFISVMFLLIAYFRGKLPI